MRATMTASISRGGFLRLGLAAAAASITIGRTALGQQKMQTRPIPSSGEALPVVGVGTWRTFDVGDKPEARRQLAEVLRVLFAAGGSVIDSSPVYGSSEAVVGELLTE